MQIEKRIFIPNSQKNFKHAKICKIKLHILNHGILKWIYMSPSIKFDLAKLICKCMNSRVMVIAIDAINDLINGSHQSRRS